MWSERHLQPEPPAQAAAVPSRVWGPRSLTPSFSAGVKNPQTHLDLWVLTRVLAPVVRREILVAFAMPIICKGTR